MKNEQRFLTVSQFAVEKEISRNTVHRWIRDGIIKDLIRYEKGPYLIPESNLALEIQERLRIPKEKQPPGPRKTLPKGPIETIEDARARYEATRNGAYDHKNPFSYDELFKMFEDNMSIGDIAKLAGVSRQAISQTHDKYFSKFLGSKIFERRHLRALKHRYEAAETYSRKIRKLVILRKIFEENGLLLEPVHSINHVYSCHHSLVSVNGYKVKVCVSRKKSKTNHRSSRFYYRTHMVKKIIETVDFVVVMTGKNAQRCFVIPSKVILGSFGEGEERKNFHFPSDRYPVYNNMTFRIDWWQFEEAWHQLKK